jgi:hypothetical protein
VRLADLAGVDGWSTVASEDVLDAIDTLIEALGGAGPELARLLLRWRLLRPRRVSAWVIAMDDQVPGRDNAASMLVARGPGRRPPRRRGLGRCFRGIRTDR